jgi:hypothetical protein
MSSGARAADAKEPAHTEALNALIELLHPLVKLVRCEVMVPVVDRLELAPVNCDYILGEPIELTTPSQAMQGTT